MQKMDEIAGILEDEGGTVSLTHCNAAKPYASYFSTVLPVSMITTKFGILPRKITIDSALLFEHRQFGKVTGTLLTFREIVPQAEMEDTIYMTAQMQQIISQIATAKGLMRAGKPRRSR